LIITFHDVLHDVTFSFEHQRDVLAIAT